MASTTMTATLTVNAAFLLEIKEVNLDLWRILAELRSLTWSAADCQSGRLLSLLEELRDQLALHFALEEAYGYFDDPAYVAPRLCEQATELRAEHRDLYTLICEVGDHAQRLHERGPASAFQSKVAAHYAVFEGRLQRHETRENELIQQQYGDDIGCAD